MSIFEAIILGLVQGLTEFIPVSSSGHLVILHHWLGLTQSGLAYDVALHLGTLLALILYFYRDILALARGITKKDHNGRVAWILLFATIPAAFVGVLIKNLAETTLRNITLVAINMIAVAFVMLAAEGFAKRYKKQADGVGKVSIKQAAIIGIAQAVSLVPGVSRSGATITAGIFAGLDRVTATRFSFLLALPVLTGALGKVVIDGDLTHQTESMAVLVTGVFTAFLSGLVAIRFLLAYLAKRDLSLFAYYRIGLGFIVLIAVALV